MPVVLPSSPSLGLRHVCPHYAPGPASTQGALTGVASRPQTECRALVAALCTLAGFTTAQAWARPHQLHGFQDSASLTVLYVSRNTKTPDAPGNEVHLRRRQREAGLAAWEGQRSLQQTAGRLAQHTGRSPFPGLPARSCPPAKYPPRHQGKRAKQRKKHLIARCSQPWQEGKHCWRQRRSGYQCTTCQVRVHHGLTVATREELPQADCSQLAVEAHQAEEQPVRKGVNQPAIQEEHPPAQDAHRNGRVPQVYQMWSGHPEAHQRERFPDLPPQQMRR